MKQTDISASDSEEIYVVNHGWHTGIIVPSLVIQSRLPKLKKRFLNSPYLEFGWGDKGFYQANQITSGLTIQAIFWPTESVMHVVSVPERPNIYFADSSLEVLCLNNKQYALLISFIEHSFHKDSYGHIVSLKNGLYGDSQFYTGEGKYNLMNTCNKWTAKGLRSSKIDIQPTFKLTAGSIMSFLSKHKNSSDNNECSGILVKNLAPLEPL